MVTPMIDQVDEGRVESPASRVDQAAATSQHGGSRSSTPIVCSALDDRRTAIHEAGHVVVGRALGMEVGGCTIVEGPDFAGLTWGPTGNSARLSSMEEVPDLCEKIANLMPAFGEPRIHAAEIYAHVFVRVTDLMSGTAAEILLHPDCAPWVAHSDIRQARALASIICTSESSIDACLLLGSAEAESLILQHRAAVLAIADALMIERSLNAERIDTIISSAPECARRADWGKVLESAVAFAAIGGKTDMAQLGKHVAV
jgi:ATP-dependent Zn protease